MVTLLYEYISPNVEYFKAALIVKNDELNVPKVEHSLDFYVLITGHYNEEYKMPIHALLIGFFFEAYL
jgi:hypothetical protein